MGFYDWESECLYLPLEVGYDRSGKHAVDFASSQT